jgi:putative oligomerization/nucleic acid binding protein
MKKFNITLLALLVALAPATASAWFFFYLPGSVSGAISDKLTGAEGDNCVGPSAKVGDRITVPGRGTGTIKSLSGTSVRCTTSEYPIRALLDFAASAEPVPASTPAVSDLRSSPRVETAVPNNSATPPAGTWEPEKSFHGYHCVYGGAKVGDGFYDNKSGNGVITRILGSSPDCPDVGAPYQAIVRFFGNVPTKAEESTQTSKPPSEAPKQSNELVQASGTTQKLRELNALLREGLITQDDYESKKQQLLKDF